MKNVLFLGGKEIGLFCLQHIHKTSRELNVHIIGCLPNLASKIGSANEIIDFCDEKGIKVYNDLNEILTLDIDIIISIQYNQILKEKHIKLAKVGAYNLHMAPLPEYRGCNQFSFAIIDQRDEFGTTLHLLNSGVDSGDIIFENRFPISEDIWIEELYEMTLSASKDLFADSWKKIVLGDIKPISQSELINKRGCSIHKRKEIQDLKSIDPEWESDKILRYVRATSMSGYDPPFLNFSNGIKLHLTR